MKKDYSGYYASTPSFVLENNLEKEAEKLFGKSWEADDDVNQIQELIDNIGSGYDVKAIEEKTARDSRVDDYIQVIKSTREVKYKLWIEIEKIITTDDDETYEDLKNIETQSAGTFDTLEEACEKMNQLGDF